MLKINSNESYGTNEDVLLKTTGQMNRPGLSPVDTYFLLRQEGEGERGGGGEGEGRRGEEREKAGGRGKGRGKGRGRGEGRGEERGGERGGEREEEGNFSTYNRFG